MAEFVLPALIGGGIAFAASRKSASGVKSSSLPAPEPQPSPVPVEQEMLDKDRARRAEKIRKFGRGSTILTMGGLGSSQETSDKGTLLGGDI